jgi:hypothetical protein
MSDLEVMQQLKSIAASIKLIGSTIEEDSVKSDKEINQILKNGRELSDKYLKPFDDSFNI